MIVIPQVDAYRVVTLALTTGDGAQNTTNDSVVMKNVNIHCYGGGVFYGSSVNVSQATQSSATPNCSILRANAVV